MTMLHQSKAFSFTETKELFEKQLNEQFLLSKAPKRLADACRYALLTGGKRIRPLIVYMMAHALGKGYDVTSAALSIEFFHTASLIADDLPSMDNDDLRRNQPTLHKAFDEPTALLASYALITSAFEKIQDSTQILAQIASNAQEVGSLSLYEAATLAGICGATGGQYEDLLQPPKTLDDLLETIRKKTVTLFQVAFIFGWLFGGGDVEKLSTIKLIGFHFGMAFQLADDLQDFTQDSPRAIDANIVKFLGKEASEEIFYKHLDALNELKRELSIDLEAFSKLQDRIQAMWI